MTTRPQPGPSRSGSPSTRVRVYRQPAPDPAALACPPCLLAGAGRAGPLYPLFHRRARPQLCSGSVFTQIIHKFIHRTLPWQTARAGVIGACSHAGPGFPLRACRAVIAPCLDRNADHVQDVPGAPRDSSLAQVAQVSLRVDTTVGLWGGRAPRHVRPASETGDQSGHLLAPGRHSLTRNLRDGEGSLRSSLRAYPCRPEKPGVAQKVPDRGDELTPHRGVVTPQGKVRS